VLLPPPLNSAINPNCPHAETRAEDLASTITHGIGLALSIAGVSVMVALAALRGGAIHVVTVSLFGAAMLLVYLSSTLYHACRGRRSEHWLRVLDHTAIYALIAGSYTPFLLVLVRGGWGWSLFGVLWGLTVAGCVFKVFFVRRFEIVSTAVYVAMGWIGLIALGPFLTHLSGGVLWWILAGGLAYTAGVAFYLWDRLPFNHATWHLFVMAGTACHFFAVLLYVVPGRG
jgi:hemolysin III